MRDERFSQQGAQDFVSRINGDTPPTDRPLSYSLILDDDLRTSLRTGEWLIVAAISKGLNLVTPDEGKGDEWVKLIPGQVMEALLVHGQRIARNVLKETRRLVNQSTDLNGDRERILKNISGLMRSLSPPPKKTFELPPIPPRH